MTEMQIDDKMIETLKRMSEELEPEEPGFFRRGI